MALYTTCGPSMGPTPRFCFSFFSFAEVLLVTLPLNEGAQVSALLKPVLLHGTGCGHFAGSVVRSEDTPSPPTLTCSLSVMDSVSSPSYDAQRVSLGLEKIVFHKNYLLLLSLF